jgi:hypothetical protein
MRLIDVSDGRRTAESVLSVKPEDVPGVISGLMKSKRLTIAMRNLNQLAQNPSDADLGKRALCHLGFLDGVIPSVADASVGMQSIAERGMPCQRRRKYVQRKSSSRPSSLSTTSERRAMSLLEAMRSG